jgi:hypothetical protein
MTLAPLLYAMNSGALMSFSPVLPRPFSAWLHFERKWVDDDEITIASLVEKGCRSILITGLEIDYVHDKVDHVAYNVTNELVLTFVSSRPSRSAAYDFITTKCPNSGSGFFVISTFGLDVGSEVLTLSKNIKLIGLELDAYSQE